MKIKTENYTVAAIVARFQVHELHEAHKELIQDVINNHPKVLIFLGLSPVKGTINNPLDFQPRKQMILEAFPHDKYPNLTVGYIKDVPDDTLWSQNLDNLIEDHLTPNDKAVLYGSRDSFLKAYNGRFPTLELVSNRIISGTQIRKMLAEKPQSDPLFRAGAIWATHQRYPVAYSTTDIAVFNLAENELLFARKPDEELLRFVGGFVSPTDNSVEEAAARELYEETNLPLSFNTLEYLGSYKVDDWRYRSEVDKIMTHFYLSFYSQGCAKASDDIAEVRWIKADKITENMIVPGHRPLWRVLKARLQMGIEPGKANLKTVFNPTPEDFDLVITKKGKK